MLCPGISCQRWQSSLLLFSLCRKHLEGVEKRRLQMIEKATEKESRLRAKLLEVKEAIKATAIADRLRRMVADLGTEIHAH